MTFASLAHATKKKVTRRDKFLAEMEAVVPWSRLLALIDPMAEERLYDSDAMRRLEA
jgi:hypothetical protein